MKHLMIDLETLGTRQDSVFVSIGACYFDPNTGDIGAKFKANIDWQSSIDAGRSVCADTLKWWFKQSPNAKSEIVKDGKDLKTVLNHFDEFILPNTSVWGNGATFDISMLENAYRHTSVPWKFWNVRDVRTVVELSKHSIKDFEFEGTPHNALDDAIHQARYVSSMWQSLTQ